MKSITTTIGHSHEQQQDIVEIAEDDSLLTLVTSMAKRPFS